MIEKPIVTISGNKILFKSNLNRRITQDLPQEAIEWRRRLDSNSKSVYIDVDFVDFDVDNVERSGERHSRSIFNNDKDGSVNHNISETNNSHDPIKDEKTAESELVTIQTTNQPDNDTSTDTTNHSLPPERSEVMNDISRAFFSQKLTGRPILHTYWADKSDFEGDGQRTHIADWIGQVQASTCTEWAIVIIEDGDFRAQLGSTLFKSKLNSSANQANLSSVSIPSLTPQPNFSFLDKMKKGLSTMFQADSGSDRWLVLINQDKHPENVKVQESYANFLKKFRSVIMTSFSKQIELFEEQLRVQREMRTDIGWNFFLYFSMQEELAFAFEFLTLFDEALVQYDLLDALFTEYISSLSSSKKNDPLLEQWTTLRTWQGLCLDMNGEHSIELRNRIVERRATLLEMRNYIFARQCDLMLMQNQPWRVAQSATIYLQSCAREYKLLNIHAIPGALTCWSFISALEVLQKCECYSCTSTMSNYSRHTVDIWNSARMKLLELGHLTHQMPGSTFTSENAEYISQLLEGLGTDPHGGILYQNNEFSPQARLRDALSGREQFSKHLVEISELTLGTYKHIGRKRHALLVGRELADFYMAQRNFARALPFLTDFEKFLLYENWQTLLSDIRERISKCDEHHDRKEEESKTLVIVEKL